VAFSADVKQELCRQPVSSRCCARAEAYGVLLFCTAFDRRQARIVTESPALKERLPLLFRKAFKLSFDQLPEPGDGKGVFLINDPDKLKAIFHAFDLEWDVHINLAVLEEEHCRTAFLRGAFLAGGSVTDPMKGYHLELATSHYHAGRELPALLREADFEPKETDRKGNRVIYFKHSDQIEDFLTFLGAPVSAMGVMAAKIERDLRGSVNRQVNCDGTGGAAGFPAGQAQGGGGAAEGQPGAEPDPAGGAVRSAGGQVGVQPPDEKADGAGGRAARVGRNDPARRVIRQGGPLCGSAGRGRPALQPGKRRNPAGL